MRLLVAGIDVLIGSSLWEGLANADSVPSGEVGCLRAVTEDSA